MPLEAIQLTQHPMSTWPMSINLHVDDVNVADVQTQASSCRALRTTALSCGTFSASSLSTSSLPARGRRCRCVFFLILRILYIDRYMFVAARMWDCCVSGRAFAGDTRERRRRPAAGGRRQLWCAYCSILWDVCDGGTITVCFFYEKQLLCSAKDAPQAVTLPPRSSGRGEGPKSPPRLSPTRSPARAFPSFCRDVSPPNYLTTFSFRFRFPSPPPPQMN